MNNVLSINSPICIEILKYNFSYLLSFITSFRSGDAVKYKDRGIMTKILTVTQQITQPTLPTIAEIRRLEIPGTALTRLNTREIMDGAAVIVLPLV